MEAQREDDLIDLAWHGELALLTPEVRSSAERIGALLAPQWVEIGQSGRLWTRDEVVASLPTEEPPVTTPLVSEREGRLLAPHIALLTYRLQFGSRASVRSSLWQRFGDAVLCVFHQGTPSPAQPSTDALG